MDLARTATRQVDEGLSGKGFGPQKCNCHAGIGVVGSVPGGWRLRGGLCVSF
jgi:hypothetical protein